MKSSELLSELRGRKVRLWVEGGELKCSAPKGVLTPELLAQIGEHKTAILAVLGSTALVTETGEKEAERAPITRARPGLPVPLTYQQQRLWFLQQLEPDLAAYNIPLNWVLKGEGLDVRALERSVEEVIRRHEVIRSVFVEVDGAPTQVVQPPPRIHLELEDNEEGLSVDAWRKVVYGRMMKDGVTAFDLLEGPLYRTRLFRVSPVEHIIYVPVHHAIFDGVSIGVFMREMIACYEAYTEGRRPSLPELPIQYADFAAWQREHFKGEGFGREMEYWRSVLSGRLPLLELPTDRPRPAVQTFNGAHKELTVPWDLIDDLNKLANEAGVTLYMVLLSVYKMLLHAHTGQTDLIVGSAINGRNHTEVEELIGFFVNTLVLRTDLAGEPTFRELLIRVRDVCLGAYEHHDVPFEWLVEEVQPERNLSYSPIFQTLFLHELEPDSAKQMGTLIMKGEPEDKDKDLSFEIARNDLTFWISFDSDEFIAWAEYNTDLFDADRIERMLEHYVHLLGEIVRDPGRPISEIQVLPDEEREKVLHTWNDTAASYSERPVHVQFEEQVDRSPDAVAVIFPSITGPDGDEQLTYRELDERASRLARHLLERGVQPGSLVGLCLERSIDMLVAQLGIQKAGTAYVPLDPGFPVDRLTYMIEDSGLSVVVTCEELRALLPDAAVDFVCLDTEAAAIAAREASPPQVAVGIDDRMYVIYTSGSTGRPKGVELEHRSVSNFLASMAREPGFRAGESLLAVTTLSFDISVLELMLPLMVGGTVMIASKEATADGGTLAALLERLQPSVMQATPATWRLLMLSGWKGSAGLRIFCGGEALPRELADELVPMGAEVWNLYGPTEATIWSTVSRVESGEGPVSAISIGRPIASTQVYVLDAHRRPAPIGVTGELWIAGDGLARGYLGRPELTAERFVPDPFSDRPGARMYVTGDLARWHADGTLECLGRVDNQVKLRGFRIELGEIESVVAEDEGVRQCVSIVREDTPGDQRLVAYYTVEEGEGGAIADTEALRAACREKLPAYMVPSAFVELDEFPLTPNAKVDRLALARMQKTSAAASEEAYVAPRNELEAKIAGVWSAVLGLERVPIYSNFFDLGGHSLLLAQARVRLEKELGRAIKVIVLFQFPTVSGLATHLAALADGAAGTPAAPQERPPQRSRGLAEERRALMRKRRTRS